MSVVGDPSGATPVLLDDTLNGAHDPNHTQSCELSETNGGAMDRYAAGATCSDPQNVAYADPAGPVAPYITLASEGALADRYFQPIAGQSSSNDMYLVRAQFVFLDNLFKPNSIGSGCSVNPTPMSFPGPTIGDALDGAGVSWAFYVEGYQATLDADPDCPRPNPDCPFSVGLYPCIMDVSDIPIDYYDNLKDDPRVLRDYAQFAKDLDDGVYWRSWFENAQEGADTSADGDASGAGLTSHF